ASSCTVPACPLLQLMIDHSVNNNTQANILLVCIHGVVSCLGILENALILWVVGFRLRRRTVASVWVLNLAMSDFLATLTLPLFTYYLSSNHSWELGQPLSFLLASISLDRCLLVAKPVWCQNHRSVIGAWKVCILGWLWAVINTLPYFVFRSVTEKMDKRKLCYHNFALYISSPDIEAQCRIRQEATAVSKTLLAFFFPLVVIAGSYIHIAITLRKRRLSPSLTPSPTTLSNQNQLSQSFTKMVTLVIAVFVLCWSPYHIFCIIEAAAEYRRDISDFVQVVLNPILYAFSCQNFCVRIRQSLGAVFDGLVEEGGKTIHQSKTTGIHLNSAKRKERKTYYKAEPVNARTSQHEVLL
uniref:Prostaglandin D2 receptor 2 n=1 Tax=Neogobius melanostomus TaxID=47308 RepID=A0A8C6SA47_9GOBI